ncbi:unnamed protein product [Effrenium voratum]|uniref:Uncharacterized protein n=1 Tax=Effrenium voratum TaxID=2562239 RepID=A0AA36MSE4_9DINO|nr:unnamed protein product [Effrenium voratum]CAJ1377417.1 unnamed protein product [Effrenium voratum]CAJ1453477.1 unnamed protein product [Effrenium voratum]
MAAALNRILWILTIACGLAEDCQRSSGGRGISLLQASRNKSAKSAAIPLANLSTDSTVSDVMAVANSVEALTNVTNATTSPVDVNPVQNLSSGEAVMNYSEMADAEEVHVSSRAPYSQRHNHTVSTVKPIKDASPIPEPQGNKTTDAMRDCIMGDWSDWSACESTEEEGFTGPHQGRKRSTVQPYLLGGELCGPAIETRSCNLISAVNTIVNLDGLS